MDNYLEIKKVGTKSKKRLKNNKPFWDEELTKSFLCMSSKEKLFLKCKGASQVKSKYKHDFIQARNIFDKLLRRKERQYNKYFVENLEKISKTDHKKFGQTINSWLYEN